MTRSSVPVSVFLSACWKDLSSEQFGLFVWPGGEVLSWFIWSQRRSLVGKRVLEIGSGAALPSLLCAKLGNQVLDCSPDKGPHA